MNNVFSADDAVAAELLLDDGVVGDGDALFVNVRKATLVHQLADGLDIRGSISNVGVDRAEHVKGSLVEAKEDAVVDLVQTQKLKNLASLRVNILAADASGGAESERCGPHGNSNKCKYKTIGWGGDKRGRCVNVITYPRIRTTARRCFSLVKTTEISAAIAV